MRVWKFQVIHRNYDNPKCDLVDTYSVKAVSCWTALTKLGQQICKEKPVRKRLFIKKNPLLVIRLVSCKKTENFWRKGKNGENWWWIKNEGKKEHK
jgi:hypothetical protein